MKFVKCFPHKIHPYDCNDLLVGFGVLYIFLAIKKYNTQIIFSMIIVAEQTTIYSLQLVFTSGNLYIFGIWATFCIGY